MHYQQVGEICIEFITRGRDAFCKGESLHQGGEKRGILSSGGELEFA
jgi:hypothetical protein